MAHKGIHDRGYLPHWDLADSVQAITFRLADSLPKKVVEAWQKELQNYLHSLDSKISQTAEAQLRRLISQYEDAGHGTCTLTNPSHANLVQDALVSNHGIAYELIDWCIMPNHVYVLIRLLDDTSLGKIIKNWKAITAIRINRLNSQTGSLWAPDYHDRLIRDLNHLENAKAYIRNNPVKANLCKKPTDWLYSSAGIEWTAEFIPREGKEHAE